jgi:hypothetical protein
MLVQQKVFREGEHVDSKAQRRFLLAVRILQSPRPLRRSVDSRDLFI